MKVLLVLNHYLPFQVAGTEVYTSLLASFLKISGHQVSVVIPNYNSTVSKNYLHKGIDVYQYGEPSVVTKSLIMGKRKPDGLVNFEKLLKELKPDIVHFQELAGSNGITLHHVELAKAQRFKTLMTFHLAGYSCMTGSLMLKGTEVCNGKIEPLKCASCVVATRNLTSLQQNALAVISKFAYNLNIDTTRINSTLGTAIGYPFIVKRKHEYLSRLVDACDKVVAITNWYKQILLYNSISSDKITFIPQALPSFSSTSHTKLDRLIDKVKLVFVGRISFLKGLHLLIEAIKLLDPSVISLDIYGSSTGDDYEKYWRERSVNCSNIRWCGKIEPGETINIMRSYDALCLPSTFSEMSPLVIQEAFAAGIPVVASKVYGNSEQIRHNVNGLLFDFNDVNSLSQQLSRLIEDKELLDQLSGNIKDPDTFERVGQEYLDLYHSLLEN